MVPVDPGRRTPCNSFSDGCGMVERVAEHIFSLAYRYGSECCRLSCHWRHLEIRVKTRFRSQRAHGEIVGCSSFDATTSPTVREFTAPIFPVQPEPGTTHKKRPLRGYLDSSGFGTRILCGSLSFYRTQYLY